LTRRLLLPKFCLRHYKNTSHRRPVASHQYVVLLHLPFDCLCWLKLWLRAAFIRADFVCCPNVRAAFVRADFVCCPNDGADLCCTDVRRSYDVVRATQLRLWRIWRILATHVWRILLKDTEISHKNCKIKHFKPDQQ